MSKDRRPVEGSVIEYRDDEARYRATFHQAAIGIVHTAPDGAILDVNPAFCMMAGVERPDLLLEQLADVLHEETARVADDHVRRLLAREIAAYGATETLRRADGTRVWVQRTVVLADDTGGDQYLIHFVENITARKSAEEEQRRRDLSFRRTLESALDCIVTTDAEGRIVEFNPMAERVFRYSRDDVIGRKLSDILVPPQLRRRHERSMRRLLTRDQESMLNRRIETIALRGDGTTIPVELMMQRITDTDPPLFTGFLRDISERKRAESRILRLNRLYRTLSHTIALIVRATDRATLFNGICRIAREHGFIVPWVALLDTRSGKLELAAHVQDEPFELPSMSLDPQLPGGRGPSATALREARIVICNDVRNTPECGVSVERCERYGIGAIAALPLIMHGKVIGVFSLKSSVAGYFDEDISQLLREMAGELAYALERLDLQAEHQRTLTALEESKERFKHLAHYDPLTELPNRSVFYERLSHGIVQADRHRWTVGEMFIDLDRFKNVNDTMGHTTGDSLLRQIAARLVDCVRAEDTVSRLSGDEFAVVLARLGGEDDAGIVAAKILERLRMPFVVDGAEIAVSASIGITLYPGDADTADVLMRNADIAMYNAKSRGRDNYQFYTAELNERALARIQLEARLRGALERDEFLLHYQPKVLLESGRVCGFEALLRWAPPGESLVSPAEFIPVLEETGLITPVGEWVVVAACRQIAAWRDAGLSTVPVAINLSARQLRRAGFPDAVARTLALFGVEPRLLEVEITESSLMENPDEAQIALRELKALGVTLAIDDFGTGYSSLAYLKRFPFDTLKIDRSFVRDIPGDSDDATITRTILALAHSLSLDVVAEGVETEEQLAFLVAHRCDHAQGFLFAKPAAADVATALLAGGEPLYRRSKPFAPGLGPAVLVLDDDLNDLILTQQLLQRDGYQVLIATTAKDALDVLASHNIAAVVSDERMPGTSGVQFFARVKRSHPDVVRIMLSGVDDSGTIAAAINEGAVHKYFVKSRDDSALREAVRRAVRRSQTRDAAPAGARAGPAAPRPLKARGF